MLIPAIEGFATGGGLIVAIGAQNAFVLTQSVRRNHHLMVAALCILFDVIFISLGVSGVGAAVASNPVLGQIAAFGGAAFLLWYGYGSLRSALRGGSLNADAETAHTLKKTLLLTMAVTLLNPHFYLDTVVLMGSLSGQYPAMDRYLFGAGAIGASTVWFLCLSLGGRHSPRCSASNSPGGCWTPSSA
ncbi:LysE/ArgO family amino acid transporter [Salidesulfovibrio onnuriiensis]|uniref:LysE/ArgO family amino acid transporter n=1 Tax=Salidesulfovibrio onnuriiensis TaxID=2583823 RepID=UPI0032B7EA6E